MSYTAENIREVDNCHDMGQWMDKKNREIDHF
jgi:hypothetical protein